MRESGRLHTILLVGVVATLMIILLVGCEADTERLYAPLPDESRDDARTAQEPAKPAAEQPTVDCQQEWDNQGGRKSKWGEVG